MNQKNVSETGYTGLDSGMEYDMKALGESQPLFYEWNGTCNNRGIEHMNFPVFQFNADHIPLGDSVGMCMGLLWVPYAKR